MTSRAALAGARGTRRGTNGRGRGRCTQGGPPAGAGCRGPHASAGRGGVRAERLQGRSGVGGKRWRLRPVPATPPTGDGPPAGARAGTSLRARPVPPSGWVGWGGDAARPAPPPGAPARDLSGPLFSRGPLAPHRGGGGCARAPSAGAASRVRPGGTVRTSTIRSGGTKNARQSLQALGSGGRDVTRWTTRNEEFNTHGRLFHAEHHSIPCGSCRVTCLAAVGSLRGFFFFFFAVCRWSVCTLRTVQCSTTDRRRSPAGSPASPGGCTPAPKTAPARAARPGRASFDPATHPGLRRRFSHRSECSAYVPFFFFFFFKMCAAGLPGTVEYVLYFPLLF